MKEDAPIQKHNWLKQNKYITNLANQALKGYKIARKRGFENIDPQEMKQYYINRTATARIVKPQKFARPQQVIDFTKQYEYNYFGNLYHDLLGVQQI